MARLLKQSDIDGILTVDLAVDALRRALAIEAAGGAEVPARVNTGSPDSWLRLMPAIIDDGDGHRSMGFKAMNLRQGHGVRYLVLLYNPASGELEAILDAAAITKTRTAALTTIAAQALGVQAPREIGVFGSGFEARGHVEAFMSVFPSLERVIVYSPNPERRAGFARRTAAAYSIDAVPVDDPREAAGAEVVVLATKTTEAVAQPDWFPAGSVVLSIGSTRRDLRELHEAAFARSPVCLCDAPHQLIEESGDVRAALEAKHLTPDQLVRLADVTAGTAKLAFADNDVRIFKSVGTALQDLAVSSAVLAGCLAEDRGIDLGKFPVKN